MYTINTHKSIQKGGVVKEKITATLGWDNLYTNAEVWITDYPQNMPNHKVLML